MNCKLIRIVAVSCVAGGFALAATPAQAEHRYRSRCGPAVVGPPVYTAPVYAAPVYSTPVYAAPVYSTPVYAAPVYGGSGVSFRFSYTRDRGYGRAYYPRSSRGFYRCR